MQRAIEAHRTRNPRDSVSYVYMYAQLLAEGGKIADAEKLAEKLRQIEKDSTLVYYWYAAGSIEYARGNYQLAADYFGKTKENDRRYFIRYMYARSLLMSGKYEKALYELKDISDDYTVDRAYFPIWSVLAYYYLGMCYEELGQYDAAIEQYTRFLQTWQNADPGMDEVTDTQTRLARLKNTP
jgi:tetratricopeptide (TPR) repeat protein